MLAASEPTADRVTNAVAQTIAAGTARLFAAWCSGSPIPEAADRRCEGVADLKARRARVWQALIFTDRLTERFASEQEHAGKAVEPENMESSENVYDGANMYIRVGSHWTSFVPTDRAGPRGPNDPLWPLDALSGANQDVTEVGADTVRGVPATHYRLTVDLGRADAALPSGVSVPSGPYRSLSRLPAEVWLDSAGRVRRISVLSEPTAAADDRIWSISELWDFGTAVDIAPPDPAEIRPPAQAYREAAPDSESDG